MSTLRPYQLLATFYHQDWGDFALQYLKLFDRLRKNHNYKPDTVLDLACGTGELISWLAGRGIRVTGLDICPEMIQQARQINPGLDLHQADMTGFELEKKFDAITCTFDSLNYLLNSGLVEKTFTQVYHHLETNGYFMFDINTPLLYQKKHFGQIVREVNGVEFQQIMPDYNPETRIALTLFDFGDNKVEEHRQKAYTVDDIKPLLEKCGYKLKEMLRNVDGDPVTADTFRIFFIAKKQIKGAL